MAEMDIVQVLEHLPQRFPMLMIDRVMQWMNEVLSIGADQIGGGPHGATPSAAARARTYPR